jgi:hypothetical protein
VLRRLTVLNLLRVANLLTECLLASQEGFCCVDKESSSSVNYVLAVTAQARIQHEAGNASELVWNSLFFSNHFISNENYIRFYKLICCDSIYDLKRLIQK